MSSILAGSAKHAERRAFFFGTPSRTSSPSEAKPRKRVRIPRPKIDKLACQAQGEGIFAAGEIPVAGAKHKGVSLPEMPLFI